MVIWQFMPFAMSFTRSVEVCGSYQVMPFTTYVEVCGSYQVCGRIW